MKNMNFQEQNSEATIKQFIDINEKIFTLRDVEKFNVKSILGSSF